MDKLLKFYAERMKKVVLGPEFKRLIRPMERVF